MHNGKSGVKAIPDGMRGVIPHLIVRGAAKAIEFYKKAFGATEIMRMPGPGGDTLGHAEIRIGDAIVFMADEFPQMGGLSPLARGGTSVTLSMYVEDVDKVFAQAVAAGATARMPPTDMFWGDRYSQVTDPFGHIWALLTHKEDVAPDEMARRAQAAFANPKACGDYAEKA
jgi:uncharacterized glyoxalase superfamily protein PhnB